MFFFGVRGPKTETEQQLKKIINYPTPMKLKTKGHITAKMPLLPPNIPFIGVQRAQAQTQRWAKTLKFPLTNSILMIDETEKQST